MRDSIDNPIRRNARKSVCWIATVPCMVAFALTSARLEGATFVGTPDRLWPGGYVPYQFADDFDGNKANVRAAMDEWEDAAYLTFEERTDLCEGECDSDTTFGDCSDAPFLFIMNDTSNHSEVGANVGNCVTGLWLNATNVGTARHELGHALGLYHEHQRADRNLFLDVHCDRIVPWRMGDWKVKSEAGFYPRLDFGYPLQFAYPNPFDFDSAMLYSPCTSSKCKVLLDNQGNQLFDEDCESISSTCDDSSGGTLTGGDCCQADPDNCYVFEPLPAYQADAMTTTSGLSAIEKLTMSFLYPEPSWAFVDLTHPLADCEDDPAYCGGFLRPYREVVDAIDDAPAASTLKIQPAYYAATGVHDKPMILDAPLGRVVLSDATGPIQFVGALPTDNCADLEAPKDCENQIGDPVRVNANVKLSYQRGGIR